LDSPTNKDVKLEKNNRYSVDPEVLGKSIKMFMAFNMEFLTHTHIPGIDRENKTLLVYRTEDKETLDNYGISEPSNEEKYTMRRGIAESGSLMEPVVVYGAHITVQQVPLHRIFGSYLTHQFRSENGGNEPEKEVVCLFEGIPFKYTGVSDIAPKLNPHKMKRMSI
jgi:hypothetical protein